MTGRTDARLLVVILVFFLSAPVGAQVGFEIPATVGLGHGVIDPPLEIVRFDDFSAMVLSPGLDAYYDVMSPRLLLVTGLQYGGYLTQVLIPNSATDVRNLWPRPLRLDATRVVVPDCGPDQSFGTVDDGIVVIEGLDVPSAAPAGMLWLGTEGPSRTTRVMTLGPRTIAWVDPGPDKEFASGDETIRVLDGIGATPVVYDLSVSIGGVDDRVIDMGEGRWGIRCSGPDGELGTEDDAVGMVFHDPTLPGPRAVTHAAGWALLYDERTDRESSWPRAGAGDSLFYASPGDDQIAGTNDDRLVFVRHLSSQPTVVSRIVGSLGLWSYHYLPGRVGVGPDGTVAMVSVGIGDSLSPRLDSIAFITPTGGNFELVETPSATIPFNASRIPDVVTLASGSTVVAHVGNPYLGDLTDDGVSVIRTAANGVHVTQEVVLGSPVYRLVALSSTAVLAFLASGQVVHLGELDQPNMTVNQVPGLQYSFSSEPVAVSPVICMASRWQAPSIVGQANDQLQVWQVQGAFTYGESTPNAAGYAMEILPDVRLPQLGMAPYVIGLDDGPPLSAAYLGLSLGRDSIRPAIDAEVLISMEQLLGLYPWITYLDGSTSLAVAVPSDPDLGGLTVCAQWVVFDAAAPRRYQLSDGLTIVF